MTVPLGSLTKAQLIELERTSRTQREPPQIYWVWFGRSTEQKFAIEFGPANTLNLQAHCYFFTNFWLAYAHKLKCESGLAPWKHSTWTKWE
jgi:hypothetical protein